MRASSVALLVSCLLTSMHTTSTIAANTLPRKSASTMTRPIAQAQFNNVALVDSSRDPRAEGAVVVYDNGQPLSSLDYRNAELARSRNAVISTAPTASSTSTRQVSKIYAYTSWHTVPNNAIYGAFATTVYTINRRFRTSSGWVAGPGPRSGTGSRSQTVFHCGSPGLDT